MQQESLYTLFQTQLNDIEQFINEDEKHTLNLLKQPMNEIIVNFPVKLKNGQTIYLKGYRVQHNNFRGPFKGGLRYHEIVSLDECKSLAGWMTIKCALQSLPFGGGKGGIKFNPRDYEIEDVKEISECFCNAIHSYIGSQIDIPAPDVGTNSLIMDCMTRKYNEKSVKRDMGVFTGKSERCGGSAGRNSATGQGVMICLREYSKYKNIDLKGKTYILQGFGNVGSYTAQLLNMLGLVCIGVGDYSEYLTCTEGFNIHKLSLHVQTKGCVKGYESGTSTTKEDFFKTKCDFVIPAALELQINEDVAKNLNCSTVIEAANGPTSKLADDILESRNIDVLPDILCNSGGVIVSYFEWLQNLRYETWNLEKIESGLDKKMTQTFYKVMEVSEKNKCSMRKASFLISFENLNCFNV